MKRRLRRICLLAMALLLMTQAALGEIDLSARGTIRLEMRSGETAVPGGVFCLYQVGSAATEGSELRFALTEDFRESGVSLDDLNASGLAQALCDHADAHKLQELRAQSANKAGEVVFSDLGCGLYLVMQKSPAEGYEGIAAFLVAIPMRGENGWSYSVIAEPKLQVKPSATPAPSPSVTATPRPTSTPSDKLPQTGMLLWPIPVLGVAGVALFVLGWILCFSEKHHE